MENASTKKPVVFQCYYLMKDKEYDINSFDLIKKSIKSVRINCISLNIDYRFIFNHDPIGKLEDSISDLIDGNLEHTSLNSRNSELLISGLKELMDEDELVLVNDFKLDEVNFDSMKIESFKYLFNQGYYEVTCMDCDVFLDNSSLFAINYLSNLDVAVPWYEFPYGGKSLRRVKSSEELLKYHTKDELYPLTYNEVTRAFDEFNISFVKFNRSLFYKFLPTYDYLLKLIKNSPMDQSLKNYILPFLPFQHGLAGFCKNNNIDAILFKNTRLRDIDNGGETWMIYSPGVNFLHYGGANKYTDECVNFKNFNE